MRKIIASVQVSLDGVMQGPGGAQEDTRASLKTIQHREGRNFW